MYVDVTIEISAAQFGSAAGNLLYSQNQDNNTPLAAFSDDLSENTPTIYCSFILFSGIHKKHFSECMDPTTIFKITENHILDTISKKYFRFYPCLKLAFIFGAPILHTAGIH